MSDPRPAARQTLAVAGRLLAATPGQLHSSFVRLVRDAPEERLEQLMHTPATRRLFLEALFWRMSQRLDRAHAAPIEASIRLQITGRSDRQVDVYDLELTAGHCRVLRGPAEREPRLTITVGGVELLRLAAGVSDPLRAYLRGGLAVSGEVGLAAKLAWLVIAPSTGGARRDRPAAPRRA